MKSSPQKAAIRLNEQFLEETTQQIKNPFKEEVNEILKNLDVAFSDTLSEMEESLLS